MPNYRSILEFLGYGQLQTELHDVRHADLHEDEKWTRMASMIPNDLLLEIGTYGSTTELPAMLRAKFGGWVDRLRFGSDDFYPPGGTPAELRRLLS